MRSTFYIISISSILLVLALYNIFPNIIYLLFIIVPYIAIGIWDINSNHNILRNYPVIGHLRYILESVRPHIQQYFIASNQSEKPFNREVRDLVYRRAKSVRNTLPFGTQKDIDSIGYEYLLHSLNPKLVSYEESKIVIGGDNCTKPYYASRLNISALSFGAISANAVLALNKGAKTGGFAQNTGEGGLSKYHLENGGDIIWQIGTGYFGCRKSDGSFDIEKFKEQAVIDNVKMIEIKLSQGAKPSHGSLLPSVKIDAEVAALRSTEIGKDSISPPSHSVFSTPKELLYLIDQMRTESGGKPVGIKLCIGIRKEFMGICKAMVETGITPDFITVDGAEGGSGAAPVEFTNRLGISANEGLIFVNNCLIGAGIRDKVKIISSGKIASGYDMIAKIALGADMCNSARAMMFALGCLQSLECNTNKCPTGITTTDKSRMKGLVVEDKYKRVANYHGGTIEAYLNLLGAMGLESSDGLSPSHINKYIENSVTKKYSDIYPYIESGSFMNDKIHSDYKEDWSLANSEEF